MEWPLTGTEPSSPLTRRRAWWEGVHLYKVVLFVASVYLFILAILLMKEGAASLAPLAGNLLSATRPVRSLGLGWFSAYILMKGSPVAAAALTLFSADLSDTLGTFAMITGSRVGASFVLLYIGFLRVLRGRNRSASLSTGLLSFAVTATVCLPALFLGAWLLHSGTLDAIQLRSAALNLVSERAVEPVVGVLTSLLPHWVVFPVGLATILLSFGLFQRCLPQRTLKESQVGWMSRLVYRPWLMFVLGALVTLISMSVIASVSLLIPLSTRGFVRRENVIPYIMGANITTFIDTMFAAVLLNNPTAFTIVLVQTFSIAIISLVILTLFYGSYQRAILTFVSWATARSRNLALFIVIVFVLPIILMFT